MPSQPWDADATSSDVPAVPADLPAEIHGTKFNDLNRNGQRDDGEPPLPGWTIYVDIDNNGQFDDGEPSAVTDADGNYVITGQVSGPLSIAKVPQAGWEQTFPASYPTPLMPGSAEPGTAKATYCPESGVLSVSVNDVLYWWLRSDGKFTGPDLADVQDILPLGGGLVSHNEDVIGEGLFVPPLMTYSDVCLGRVVETGIDASEIWLEFGREFGDVNISQTVVGCDGEYVSAHEIEVAPEQIVADVDFGSYSWAGEIRGTVWNDANHNHVRDAGEAGIDGWVVFLDANLNGQHDAGERSTFSGADGTYAFTNVAPGTYQVVSEYRNGWRLSTDVSPVVVEANEFVEGVDIGRWEVLFLSPFVRSFPMGSLVYGETVHAAIEVAEEIDEYTVFLDGNQTVRLIAGHDVELQPTVELFAPGGESLGTATATAPTTGARALLPAVPAVDAGTYTITVRDAGEATGNYMLHLTLNATSELELYGGPQNDSLATAEDLDGSLFALGVATARRGVVRGKLQPDEGDHEDWYRLTLDDGQSASFTATALPKYHPRIQLYDAAGTLLAAGLDSTTAGRAINRFVDPTTDGAADEYFVRVYDGKIGYSLVVTRDADFESQAHYLSAYAPQELSSTDVVLGYSGDYVETEWSMRQRVEAPVGRSGDLFGHATAVDGDVAVVGAPHDDLSVDTGSAEVLRYYGTNFGSAHVFRYDGVGWQYEQKLAAADAAAGALFGSAVAVDGDVLVVGAGDWQEGLLPGSVYVFNFDGTRWVQQQKLTAPDGYDGALFGSALDIDGDVIVAGAYEDNHAGVDSGSAHVFQFDGGQWQHAQKLTASDATAGARFGRSVAVFGESVIVGAPGVNTPNGDPGAAYVFHGDGSRWTEAEKLLDPDADSGGGFGTAVALDGTTAVVGSPKNLHPGSAIVYEFDGSRFRQQQLLASHDPYHGDIFGAAVAVSGETIAVGMPRHSSKAGSVHVFSFDGRWVTRGSMGADTKGGDVLGTALGVSGKTVLAGNSDTFNLNYGEAWFYQAPDARDAYAVYLDAGEELIVTTTTPGDGPGEFVNTLDPALELLDPELAAVAADDNGGLDGRNAQLHFTATQSGMHLINVRGSGAGAYVLKLDGNGTQAAFEVTSTDPTSQEVLAGRPDRLTVRFSDAVRLDTLEAADLTIGGLPAVDVTVGDVRTLSFGVPGELGDGVHQVTLPDGAILDVQGTPIEAFSTTLNFDGTPPTVAAFSLPADAVLPPGPLVCSLQFDDRMLPASFASGFQWQGVELIGQLTGRHPVESYDFDSVSSTLSLQFGELSDDRYRLRLKSTYPRYIQNLAGLQLSSPQDFAFSVDADVLRLPAPRRVEPVGSLIGTQSATGYLATEDDVDEFSIDVDARQTVTVVVAGDAALQPVVALRDPGGRVVAGAMATGPGGDAVLQKVPMADAGTYTVIVSDAVRATGAYSIELILNASVELSQYGGPPNDTRASAEDFDRHFIPPGFGTAERGAVLGTVAGDEDWYRFTLDDGQTATLALANVSTFDVLTFGLYDQAGELLTTGRAAENAVWTIDGFRDATGDGQDAAYFVRVAGQRETDYSLLVTRDADLDVPTPAEAPPYVQDITHSGTVLGALGDDLQGAISFAALGDYGLGGSISISIANMMHGWDPDFVITTGNNNYAYTGVGSTAWTSNVGKLFGDFVKRRSDGVYPELSSPVQRFFPTRGDYDRVVAGYLDYFHDDPDGGRLPDGVHNGAGSYYDFRFGPAHFFALDSNLTDASQKDWLQNKLATSTATWKFVYFQHSPYSSVTGGGASRMRWPFDEWGADVVLGADVHNYECIHLNDVLYFVTGTGGRRLSSFTPPWAPGSQARYNRDFGAMRIVVDGSRATFEFTSIDDEAYGARGGRLIDSHSVDKSSYPTGAEDRFAEFAVEVAAGDMLRIETHTPGDGPREPINLLDPRIELYDPAGALVAADEDGAGDGHNARLLHTATATGTYTVHVAAEHDTSGEFVLNVDGHTGAARAFAVAETDPPLHTLLPIAPPTLSVRFDDGVLVHSLDAGDLTVDGVPALGVVLRDSRTAVFDLPRLDTGIHQVAIAAAALRDLQGTPNEAYTATLTVNPTELRVMASSLQEGDAVAVGALTATMKFNKELRTAELDTADVVLLGDETGQYQPDVFQYDAASATLSLQFADLPEDGYTLTLTSGDGGFEDTAGSNLDGEPVSFPLPPNISGDGVPGGDFVVRFFTDRDAAQAPAFPLPLRQSGPAGGLVYTTAVDGLIGPAGDEDRFTIDVEAGQTISVVVSTHGDLLPTVELSGPQGTSLAAATAKAGRQSTFLQTLPASVAGTYTAVVGSASDEEGTYTVQLILGAAVEAGEHIGLSNGRLDLAEDLDVSFLPLDGGSAQRGALLGTLRNGDDDWYRFTLAEGQPATAMLAGLAGANPTLALFDEAANLLATAEPVSDAELAIIDFAAPDDGAYYVHLVGGAGDPSLDYSLLVTRGAVFDVEPNDDPVAPLSSLDTAGVALGYAGRAAEGLENGSFETGSFTGWTATVNDKAELTPWTVGPAGGGFFFDSAPADGVYSVYNGFDGAAGLRYELYQDVTVPRLTSATLLTHHRIVYSGNGFGENERKFSISVLDADGAVLDTLYTEAVPPDLAPPTDLGWNRQVFDLSAHQGRTVRVCFSEEIPDDYAGPAMFELDDVSLLLGPTDADSYEISLAEGDSIVLSTGTPLDDPDYLPINTLDPTLAVFDADGNLLAADADSHADGKNAVLPFTAPAAGTYIVRVDAESGWGEYTLRVERQTGVVARRVFYNNSAFDGEDPSANAADDAAVAIDKQALLPGKAASFANYTSFAAGINGIMVDVAGLADGVVPDASDFQFRVGTGPNPDVWTAGPVPSEVTLRPGAGADGSDRVTLVWPDFAIRNQWLQVTVFAEHLGLPADDAFYFGNAVGDAGNSTTEAMVTTTDLLLARNNPRNFLNPAAVDFAYDYNRDQRVSATDVLLARNNVTNFLTALKLLDLSGAAASPAETRDGPATRAVDKLLLAYWL